MSQSVIMLCAIFVPILWGLCLLVMPELKNRKTLTGLTGFGLVITAALALTVIAGGETEVYLFSLGKNMNVLFHLDNVGRLFATVVTIVWVLAGFYAFEYMKHEKEEKRYFGDCKLPVGLINE